MAAGLLAAQAVAGQAETLGDALASAYKASNLLANKQALLRASDEDLATAVAAIRPVISWMNQASYSVYQYKQTSLVSTPSGPMAVSSMAYTNNLKDLLSLSAQLTLYDFGRSQAGIDVAHQTVLSTEEALTEVEQQVLLAAAQAYVQVTVQTQMVAMQQSNVELVSQDLKAAKDKFDVGEVTMTDVSQAEAQLASAKAQLAAAQGQLALARESYKAAVGHYPGKLSPLPPAPNLPKTLAEAQKIALATNPQLLSVKYQVSAADAQVTLAKANMLPTLVGQAQIGDTFNEGAQPTNANSLSITMNQTIYAGGKLSALYRKSLDQQDAARAALAQQAVTVSQGVGNAWSGIDVARVSIAAGDQQVVAAQAALDGTKQEAAVGSRTTLDVLNADQVLLNAKAGRLQSVANLYNGQYSLLAAMGLMTAKYLKLGIPTYDPQAYYNAVKNAPATAGRGARLDKILKLMGRN